MGNTAPEVHTVETLSGHVLNLERVRSLILTNCDTHNIWLPEAFKPFLGQAAAGDLSTVLHAMLSDKAGRGDRLNRPRRVRLVTVRRDARCPPQRRKAVRGRGCCGAFTWRVGIP
jgi:hypothetical protein